MGKFDNKILCVKKDKLFSIGEIDGFQSNSKEKYIDAINLFSEFKVRSELENDETYLQIIPQIYLNFNNKYLLVYEPNSAEKKLSALSRIFLGGHVEEFDKYASKDIIEAARDREIKEEVTIKSKILSKDLKGFVYLYDENPVNHVHLGVVYEFKLDGTDIETLEEGTVSFGFVDKQYLIEHINEITYWTRIYLDYLI